MEIESNFAGKQRCKEEVIEKLLGYWIENQDEHAPDLLFIACTSSDHSKILEIMKYLEINIENTWEELHAVKIIIPSYPFEMKELTLKRMLEISKKMIHVLRGRMSYLLGTHKTDQKLLDLLGSNVAPNQQTIEKLVERLDERFDEELKSKEDQHKSGEEVPFYKYPSYAKAFEDWIHVLKECTKHLGNINNLQSYIKTQISNLALEIKESCPVTIWNMLPMLATSRFIENAVGYMQDDSGGRAIVKVLLSFSAVTQN